jgi:predicted metalloprotease with PDZ domain
VGDSILEINKRVAGSDFEQRLAELHPGDTVYLRVRSGQIERGLRWKVASREEVDYRFQDVSDLTSQQKARRTAWLKGESQSLSGDLRP